MKVVIIGGGWAGCAASLTAVKAGAEVVLLERTDMLLGTGLVGGIMRNNGRFTAAEELIAMGAGELFELTDKNSLHKGIDLPGNFHSSIYNVATMEPIVRRFLVEMGIKIHFQTRFEDCEVDAGKIKAVIAKMAGVGASGVGASGVGTSGEKVRFEADVFIDATGTAGPPGNCTKYGNGCAMCILRCVTFGGRVSVAEKAGIKEFAAKRDGQTGAMSGSCKLFKESLSQEIIDTLNKKGLAVIPIPEEVKKRGKLEIKACQQYALPEFEDNVVLVDTGHAKLMTPFFPLEALRRVPGFENARYEDPYAGGVGNSIRFTAISPRDDALKVKGIDNLFCAGEKAGLFVGHTEAITTGTLAGYNAVRHIKKQNLLVIPTTLAVGDIISYVSAQMFTEEGLSRKYTFSGSVYFERMKELGLYSVDVAEVSKRVDEAKMSGVFGQ